MTVYLDLVVLLNFLVDLLLLMGTNRLAGYPAALGRSAAAALLGGIYGGVCLLPGFGFLSNTLWRTVSLGLMGVMGFGLEPGALRRCVIFVLLSYALGGVALGLGSGSFFALVTAAGALTLMCLLGFQGKSGNRYVPVKLIYGEQRVELTALHDTGNTLRDPVTGEQVLVVGPTAAKQLTGLTRNQLRSPVETVAAGKVPGLRLIPYRAVGQAQGMLLGLRIADSRIGKRKGSVLVAFAPDGLGEDCGEFEALIGGAI